ncbi:hypothetical protein ACLKA6_014349 [Drosophila palustris]
MFIICYTLNRNAPRKQRSVTTTAARVTQSVTFERERAATKSATATGSNISLLFVVCGGGAPVNYSIV